MSLDFSPSERLISNTSLTCSVQTPLPYCVCSQPHTYFLPKCESLPSSSHSSTLDPNSHLGPDSDQSFTPAPRPTLTPFQTRPLPIEHRTWRCPGGRAPGRGRGGGAGPRAPHRRPAHAKARPCGWCWLVGWSLNDRYVLTGGGGVVQIKHRLFNVCVTKSLERKLTFVHVE